MYMQAVSYLEYFAGEKHLRLSQISRKFDPLRSTIGRIVCYTYRFLRLLSDQHSQNRFCLMLAKHFSSMAGEENSYYSH